MLVYIIVFKEDIERKRPLTARFREIGLEPTFIDAIKGSELPTEEQKKISGHVPEKSGLRKHFAAML